MPFELADQDFFSDIFFAPSFLMVQSLKAVNFLAIKEETLKVSS